MWKVSATAPNGKPSQFYILGVTHNGLQVEFDSYYTQTVLPAFQAAKVIVDESAPLGPNAPGCPVALPVDSVTNDLFTRARENVIAYRLKEVYHMPDLETGRKKGMSDELIRDIQAVDMKMASDYAENLSEFALYFLSGATLGETFERTGLKPVQIELQLTRPQIPVESIESMEELAAGYCGTGVIGRRELFHMKYERIAAMRDDARMKKFMESQNKDFTESLKQRKTVGTYVIGSPMVAEAFVCGRNRNWVQRIKSNLGSDGRFYILGLSHLLSSPYPNLSCDNLLESLKAEGMSVTLVP